MTLATDLTNEIKTRLESIRKEGGYLTDLGSAVYRGSSEQIINDLTQLPAALMRTSSDGVEDSRPGKAKRTRTVLVEAYVQDDSDYEPLLDDIAHDIYRSVSSLTTGEQISRAAMSVEIGGFDYDHPSPGERVAVISTEIRITYVETYNQ
ncbi:MAG: hypothetical protein ACOCPR_06830 [Guyparkeria sp.]